MKVTLKRIMFVFAFLFLGLVVLTGCSKGTTVFLGEGVSLKKDKQVLKLEDTDAKLKAKGYVKKASLAKNETVEVLWEEKQNEVIKSLLVNEKAVTLKNDPTNGHLTHSLTANKKKIYVKAELKTLTDQEVVEYALANSFWNKKANKFLTKDEAIQDLKTSVQQALTKTHNEFGSFKLKTKLTKGVTLKWTVDTKDVDLGEGTVSFPLPGEAQKTAKFSVVAELATKDGVKASAELFKDAEYTLKPLVEKDILAFIEESVLGLYNTYLKQLNKTGEPTKYLMSKNTKLGKIISLSTSAFDLGEVDLTWSKTGAEDAVFKIEERDEVPYAVLRKGAVADNVELTATYNKTWGDKAAVKVTAKLELKQDDKWSFAELWVAVNEGEFEAADDSKRLDILLKLEEHFLSQVPKINIMSSNSSVLFSDRVELLHDYFPVIGLETRFAKVKPLNGVKVYRSSITAVPSHINPFDTKDSAQSDVLDLVFPQMFDFFAEKDSDGKYTGKYEMKPVFVKSIKPINPLNGKAKKWEVEFNKNVYWTPGEYKGNTKTFTIAENTEITADDIIYSYQQLLDKKFGFSRANLLYGSSFPVKKAKDFYDGKCAWDAVGITKNDAHTIVYELERPMSEFKFKYAFPSTSVAGPVYKPLFEDTVTTENGLSSTTYGTKKENFVSFGPYKIDEWFDKDKGYTLVKDNKTGANSLLPSGVEFDIEKRTHTIVKDSNASLLLFEKGDLDVTGVPSAAFDKYKDNPNRKVSPQATVFGLNVNLAKQDEVDSSGTFKVNEFLHNLNFRKALNFIVDRETIAKDLFKGTRAPEFTIFTKLYIAIPETGEIYTTNSKFKKMVEGLGLNPDTFGHNKGAAKLFLEAALKEESFKALLKKHNNKITLVVDLFDGPDMEKLGAELKKQIEGLPQAAGIAEKDLKIAVTLRYNPGLDIYYQRQIPGKYELAISGFSGSLLDPWNFLEVFLSDNRSGIFLNWGFNTDIPGVIEYDPDVDYYK